MKMEECKDSELSDVFNVKLVAKNIAFAYPETEHQAVTEV